MATSMKTIEELGLKQAPHAATINQPLANERARHGAGAALASMLIDETMLQAGKLKMYIQSLVELDPDGRKGFTDYLKAVMKERQHLVKENGTALYKKINASAAVRLSEFKKVADALDAGIVIDISQNYHTIIGQARQHLDDLRSTKETRGRKATHAIVKAMKYLKKLEDEAISPEDKAMVDALFVAAEHYCTEAGLAVDKTAPEAPM